MQERGRRADAEKADHDATSQQAAGAGCPRTRAKPSHERGAPGSADRLLLIGAAATYLLGVQPPTVAINVPLSNRLKVLDLDGLDAAALRAERVAVEGRRNRWNAVRTAFACVRVVALLILIATTRRSRGLAGGEAL